MNTTAACMEKRREDSTTHQENGEAVWVESTDWLGQVTEGTGIRQVKFTRCVVPKHPRKHRILSVVVLGSIRHAGVMEERRRVSHFQRHERHERHERHRLGAVFFCNQRQAHGPVHKKKVLVVGYFALLPLRGHVRQRWSHFRAQGGLRIHDRKDTRPLQSTVGKEAA